MSRDPNLSESSVLPDEAVQEVLAQDGGVTAEVRAALAAKGVDSDELRRRWHRIRALMLPPTDAPDLVPMVFDALELERLDVDGVLLDGAGGPPELAASVLQAVELSFIGSHDVLIEGSGVPPELSKKVLSEVGLAATFSQDVLLEASGLPPELAESVLETVELPYTLSHDTLLEASGPSPELSEPVLRDLDLPITSSRAGLLDGCGEPPEVAGSVLDSVDLTASHSRDALLEGSGLAPELSASVLAQLEHATDLGFRRAIVDEAGSAPDLSASIFGELGFASVEQAPPTPVVPLHPVTVPDAASTPAAQPRSKRRWLWAVPAVALPAIAMAAAALFMMLQAVVVPVGEGWVAGDELGFSPDVVNRIEIEEISAAADAIVHVIQGDIDDDAAPTIIFIDVLEDDADEAETGNGGTTL